MRGLREVMNHFRFVRGNKILAGSFFVIGLLSFGVLGITQYTGAQADIARDCDDNAIIRCGTADANEFRAKYDANAPGDLKTIYDHYWIPRDIQVVEGVAYKDGTVRVGGRIVAKNAASIGRQQIKGSYPISIGGKTYYQASNADAFIHDALPAMVALDAQGNFKYAIIHACGNPIYATPVPPPTPPQPPKETPKYSCDSLTKLDVSTTQKRFTAAASATGGATITGYTFDFGDGKQQSTTDKTIDHTYAPGTYTAKVTVNVSVDGATKTATGPACEVQVTVPAPAAVGCTALTLIDKGDNSYDFTIQETHTNATYTGATLDFGDGKTAKITGLTASHQYAKAGNYTISATLSFTTEKGITQAQCQAHVTMTPCPTNPELPANSPSCTVCQYDTSLPADSPKCVPPVTPTPTPTPPTELPETGPGNIMLGGLGFGSMIISASFYLGSRRDLLAALGQ